MKSVSIMLQEAQNIKSFVSIINKYPYDIDLRSGRYVVDAKSFLGVYGLDFRMPLTVVYDGYNANLEEFLKKYAIAC